MSQTSTNNPARRCFDIGATPSFDDCTWGNRSAPKHMYLVGDSTAMAYAPAFKAMAEASGDQWQITTIGLYGCRFTDVLVQNDGDGVMDACPQRKQDVADRIRADAPQLIVMSNAFALGQSSARQPLSTSDLVASTLAEAAEYNAAGRVVYLAPPPLGAPLGQCYSKVSSPIDCAVNVDAAWNDFEAAFEAGGAGDRRPCRELAALQLRRRPVPRLRRNAAHEVRPGAHDGAVLGARGAGDPVGIHSPGPDVVVHDRQ